MAKSLSLDGADVTARGPRAPRDEGVYHDVYDAILDHRLPPGTKLTEDSLGEIFGVSRTVVRKALLRLGHENIVRLRPNRGAVVASPSTEEARDVFAARRILEAAVIGEAAPSLTEADIETLRALVAQEGAAFERGDRSDWIRLSGAFHLRLAALAGNEVIGEFLKELVSRTSLIIALYETPGRSACAVDEHDGLIDALASGDTAAALGLMDAHLRRCEEKLNLEDRDDAVDLGTVFADVVREPRPRSR